MPHSRIPKISGGASCSSPGCCSPPLISTAPLCHFSPHRAVTSHPCRDPPGSSPVLTLYVVLPWEIIIGESVIGGACCRSPYVSPFLAAAEERVSMVRSSPFRRAFLSANLFAGKLSNIHGDMHADIVALLPGFA
jgi:hypothetical protein